MKTLGVRKCKNCKRPFRKEQPLQFVCSPECGYKWARRDVQKQSEAKHKELKRRVSDGTAKQRSLTVAVARRLANLLDRDKTCISCDRPRGNAQFCGGHYKTAGGHPELAYDVRNIFGQCNRYCNRGLSGNISGTKTTRGMKAGIVARFGQDYLNWLDGPHENNDTIDDMKAKRKAMAAEIRHLMAGGKATRDWRAI